MPIAISSLRLLIIIESQNPNHNIPMRHHYLDPKGNQTRGDSVRYESFVFCSIVKSIVYYLLL